MTGACAVAGGASASTRPGPVEPAQRVGGVRLRQGGASVDADESARAFAGRGGDCGQALLDEGAGRGAPGVERRGKFGEGVHAGSVPPG